MSNIKIGWASRDITTDKPVNLAGQFHMRPSRGVMDPTMVTALVVDDGKDCVIFLSFDLGGLRYGILDGVRGYVSERMPEIPVMKILSSATHTHTGGDPSIEQPTEGPGGIVWGSSMREKMGVASSDEYRSLVIAQAGEAVIEAWQSRTNGGIAYGYGYAVAAHSRRVVYFDDISLRPGAVKNSTHGVDGHARMYGNTNDDNFSHYEAGSDHFVNLLFTFDADDRLTGAIVNVPCPSQNSEQEYYMSADYWHDVRLAIRAKYGNIFILPQCAAAGDLSPRILHYKDAQARRFRLKYGEIDTVANAKHEIAARRDIAERIAAAFDEVYSWAGKEIFHELPVAHSVSTVNLSRRLITDEEYKEAVSSLAALEAQPWYNTGDKDADLRSNNVLEAGRGRQRGIIRRYEQQKTEPKLPMELHVLRIGDVAFCSNRFELYMDYQHRIQARSPFTQTFIIQLSGQPGLDSGSYLCTQRGFEGRGYSASMYCNLVGPEGGQELVEETVRILKELSEENRD
ncbi:MAG: hypothetical protein E7463_11430 [Ruminococcaceae bacterium]|nr:hypothetical protein [Oscillospiraceae bacterium]